MSAARNLMLIESQPNDHPANPSMRAPMIDKFLAGDIGGTKTILALYSAETGPDQPSDRTVFPSRDYSSLEQIITDYLADKEVTIKGACFGVAGPVIDERVQATNLPWVVEASKLSANMGDSPVWLSNDLIATAMTVPQLREEDLYTLKPGVPEKNGVIGVLAPGTGLGEGFLTWNGASYSAHPSEGGHSNFGPASPLEIELLSYLQRKIGHVSFESVCSGMGIPNLYAFYRDVKKLPEPDWLRDSIASTNDPVPIIARTALERKSEICEKTMELFFSILANEAGNMALNILATGGIFLGGGIPPRILPLIDAEAFRCNFVSKGRFEKLLDEIPVYVILKPDAALFGAACQVFEIFGRL